MQTDLAIAADWTNATNFESPEVTVPGANDIAAFLATPAKALTGTIKVAQAYFLSGPTNPWAFSAGQLSAGGLSIQSPVYVLWEAP